MKIVCVVHDEERILDVTRESDRYTIGEREGASRQEIHLSENEASRIVQVSMELQQDGVWVIRRSRSAAFTWSRCAWLGSSADSGKQVTAEFAKNIREEREEELGL